MAEILTLNYNYKISIYTSNAIDFKALRNSNGKTLSQDNKYYEEVNSLKINRFKVNYKLSEKEILNELKKIPTLKLLNLNDDVLITFIKNGPYLGELLENLLQKPNLTYDLIHTTFFPYFNCIISLIIGNYIHKPTICTPFFHFSNPRYMDLTIIEVLKKFDLIIACTNLEKQFLIQNYNIQPEKIKVIPMGVDIEKFSHTHKNPLGYPKFKQKFFNTKEKKYKLILFCGYKNYEKGAISILKSISNILKKIKKVYFVFIGPSTLAFNRELSKINKLDNVNILNFSPDNLTGYFDKKKIAVFKEADIYLMPSRSDAFGISFLEAWAAGKPVIGARIGATPEVIRDNIDGLLVNFDNPDDISKAVVQLLKSKKLRKRLGAAGKDKVSYNYTWDEIVKQTYDIYSELKRDDLQ